MKISNILQSLVYVLMFTALSSCHSNDDNGQSAILQNQAAINSVNQSMAQGNWHVSYYFDSATDETSNFINYTFTFGSGNILTATNGTNTYTGSWLVTNSSNSGDDTPHSDIDFNIAFTSPAAFADLTDDWHIVSYTSSRIELIDVSGGNGGTDTLIFEKN